MLPTIQVSKGKMLVGKHLAMSLTNDRTGELWRSFMQQRKEISNAVGTEYYSIQVYGRNYFDQFDPNTEFYKWATVEVTGFDEIPTGMEAFTLPGGLYAVFHYKGLSSDPGIFQYIFATWLPNSDYLLDDRPHFEVLGEKYKNNDPASEETIWIPIRPRL